MADRFAWLLHRSGSRLALQYRLHQLQQLPCPHLHHLVRSIEEEVLERIETGGTDWLSLISCCGYAIDTDYISGLVTCIFLVRPFVLVREPTFGAGVDWLVSFSDLRQPPPLLLAPTSV